MANFNLCNIIPTRIILRYNKNNHYSTTTSSNIITKYAYCTNDHFNTNIQYNEYVV